MGTCVCASALHDDASDSANDEIANIIFNCMTFSRLDLVACDIAPRIILFWNKKCILGTLY